LKIDLDCNNVIEIVTCAIFSDGGSRKLFLKDVHNNYVGIKLDRRLSSEKQESFLVDVNGDDPSTLNEEGKAKLKKILSSVKSKNIEELKTVELFQLYL
jgi:hypothetical protein